MMKNLLLRVMKFPVIKLVVCFVSLGLASCGHVYTKSHSYEKSPTVTINGAKVGSAVKPMGGNQGFAMSAMVYMAGSATLDGPFIWRVEAEGKEGEHKHMVVHRIKVITSKTKRSEWYPQSYLGFEKPFKHFKKEPGKVYAVYQIPGKLKVFPREDGDITMLADVSIVTNRREVRKLVKFQLKSGTKRDVEFVSLPAEIVKGRQKDPREWKW